ncbi:MAG: hypothetical protein ACTSUC_00035 [Promethearchaeota archaeon]
MNSFKVNPEDINLVVKMLKKLDFYERQKIPSGVQLKVNENGEEYTINLFNTGSLVLQGKESPFKNELEGGKISKIIKTVKISFNKNNERILIGRAKRILDYLQKIILADEVDIIVAIILCDTACEILLKERMFLICEQENIPNEKVKKIKDRTGMLKFISDKGYIEVLKTELINLRKQRNDIVHAGAVALEDEAKKAINLLKEYYSL